ncbi:helix-turn-helix transcriptional regulator [uncultured Marixanthomonas sp.]|uniref:helix-turn-helix domain-containing protein n=1 Tax=uncultured Marixanthomonas sp. TaxID=757245 RepID=UPI0030DA32A8|tara:strand:+ start:18262 stop:18483 length:222 start_codon:yes stop_codon:yes gene_type:complete
MKEKELTNLLIKIGAKVKLERSKKNLSQFELGLEIGKSANQIGRIERAETNPTVETLLDLANFFRIDLKDLIE